MNIAQFCHPFWFKKVPNEFSLRNTIVYRHLFSLLNYFENFGTVETHILYATSRLKVRILP